MKKNFLIPLCGLIFLFSACEKVNVKEEVKLEVTPESVVVYSEGTAQLSANVDDAIFESSDTFYAKVDENGLVTGNRVGETEIVVSSSSGKVIVPVTIRHRYSLYPDVDVLIGKRASDVTNLLGSSYTKKTSSSGAVNYNYTDPTPYTDYITVTLTDGKCSGIGVLVDTKYTSMLTKHILERYALVDMENDIYYFVNHDMNVFIGLTVYSSSYLAVVYIPFSSTKSEGISLKHSIDMISLNL